MIVLKTGLNIIWSKSTSCWSCYWGLINSLLVIVSSICVRVLVGQHRRDEVMLEFGDKCQMLGLEVDGMALIIEFPLTPPVCQDSNDLGIIGSLVKSIKRLRGDMIKIIKVVDRLRTGVDQHTLHSNLLNDVGGEVGVEFSHHTHRRWMRCLGKCPPSLGRNSLAEKVARVLETLYLNK